VAGGEGNDYDGGDKARKLLSYDASGKDED
jgi:hypothetical protein